MLINYVKIVLILKTKGLFIFYFKFVFVNASLVKESAYLAIDHEVTGSILRTSII